MNLRQLAALSIVTGLAACHHIPERDGVLEPGARHFLDFPATFRGLVVRLPDLEAARVDITRPLVFLAPGAEPRELVLSDPRSLARTRSLRRSERVNVVFRCEDGRTDRGNLLLAIERPPPGEAAPTSGGQ